MRNVFISHKVYYQSSSIRNVKIFNEHSTYCLQMQLEVARRAKQSHTRACQQVSASQHSRRQSRTARPPRTPAEVPARQLTRLDTAHISLRYKPADDPDTNVNITPITARSISERAARNSYVFTPVGAHEMGHEYFHRFRNSRDAAANHPGLLTISPLPYRDTSR